MKTPDWQFTPTVRHKENPSQYRTEYSQWRRKYRNEEVRIADNERRCGGNWKKAIERDNWTCQMCGKDLKKHRPQVHHKDFKGFRIVKLKADNRLFNLISLCCGCHTKIHQPYSLKGKWSRKHDFCQQCGTTNRPYQGLGLCESCYEKRRGNIRNESNFLVA